MSLGQHRAQRGSRHPGTADAGTGTGEERRVGIEGLAGDNAVAGRLLVDCNVAVDPQHRTKAESSFTAAHRFPIRTSAAEPIERIWTEADC